MKQADEVHNVRRPKLAQGTDARQGIARATPPVSVRP